MSTIFVSIASYRDSQLVPTVRDCLTKACFPDRLRFGVCWQHGLEEVLPGWFAGDQFRVFDVDWSESQGACWARAEVMRLWDGEDWYLQLDSHHRFAQNWDIQLLAQAAATASPRPVVTTYGDHFTPDIEGALAARATRIDFDSFTSEGAVLTRPGLIGCNSNQPIKARFVSAHFLFAPGRFVEDVPYDPDLYFIGEEITLAVRAFTHGYDLFHPGEHIVWHEYTRSYRPRHWDDHTVDSGVDVPWNARDEASRQKVARFLAEPFVGRYGLGTARSFADYEAYAGLSFRTRRAQDYTRHGHEPPNPPTDPHWARHGHERRVEITLDVAALPPAAVEDPSFWYVGIHDGAGRELYRADADVAELRNLLATADRRVTLVREFESEAAPASWTVLPHSASQGWLKRVTSGVLRTDAAALHSAPSEENGQSADGGRPGSSSTVRKEPMTPFATTPPAWTPPPTTPPPTTPPPTTPPPTTPSPPVQTNLTNSQRFVNKATYAPAKLPAGTSGPGHALEKAAFIRRLGITDAEFGEIWAQAAADPSPSTATPTSSMSLDVLNLVAQVTNAQSWPDGLRRYGNQLARTSHQQLVNIGREVVELRQAAADQAAGDAPAAAPGFGDWSTSSAAQPRPLADLAGRTRALVTVFNFSTPSTLSTPRNPIGALHLERMEMTPVGVEHGELVHSVPMTPGETVNIAHKEWSVTSETFETIVTGSFEGFSETGVTEKTDLTQATESETKHSTSLDINGSVTATYNGGAYSVTAAAAANYSDKNDTQNIAKQSIAHSLSVTRHASARTRKEHKTSFKVSSVAGAEDLAVRTLHNATDHAIRVDYFQLIRKWRVDLIRYGLRLTYDLVVPNPGLDLIGQVLELQKIEEMLSTASFNFTLTVDQVTPDTYTALAARYAAAVDPPPNRYTPSIPINVSIPNVDDFGQDTLELEIPDDYGLESGSISGDVHNIFDGHDTSLSMLGFDAVSLPGEIHPGKSKYLEIDLVKGTANPGTPSPGNPRSFKGFPGVSGKVVIEYFFSKTQLLGKITGGYRGEVRKEALAGWQLKTWVALREAAQANFDRNLVLARDRKAFLEQQISQFDALTLRKMEHEEVMKWVLEWLMPSNPLTSNPISSLAVDWPPPVPSELIPTSATPLYRLFNPSTGDHFYTASVAERDHAVTGFGYQSEGEACLVYAMATGGTVPLHRLVKTDHFYTVSDPERDNAIANLGYQSEGEACYVYAAATTGTVLLHRLVGPNGHHFYTTSDAERDNAIANLGYQSESEACYVYPVAAPPDLTTDLEGIEGVDPDSVDKGEVLTYGELIKFLHDAVEWENMLFFVYPYFWDAVENWPFKRFLLHPDPVHREFLRGGAARVILTIRPGFEDTFVKLVEMGDSTATDEDIVGHGKYPYVTLGQEVRNQALTNYENIPPANPDRVARPLLYPLQRYAWNDMQNIIAVLEEYNRVMTETLQPDNGQPVYPPGPEAGLPGVLKHFLLAQPQTITGTGPNGPITVPSMAARLWKHLQTVKVKPAGNFDAPDAIFIDPWEHPYHYTTPTAATPVLHGDYELVCYGSNNQPGSDPNDPLSEDLTSWAEGLLIAQWYEYTPTSALDVSVDAPLTIGGTPLGG